MEGPHRTWEKHEKRCANAREALFNLPPGSRKRRRLQKKYEQALKDLQGYLTRRYGWRP